MGSRKKYEVDHETWRIRLDRTLFTATRHPADYGYIEGTLGEEGDPHDCHVLVQEPTFPGSLIKARPQGVFWMNDEKGRDAKSLALPADDPRLTWQELDDVSRHVQLEISHFFDIYEDLDPGTSSDVHGWDGRKAAEDEIAGLMERHLKHVWR